MQLYLLQSNVTKQQELCPVYNLINVIYQYSLIEQSAIYRCDGYIREYYKLGHSDFSLTCKAMQTSSHNLNNQYDELTVPILVP